MQFILYFGSMYWTKMVVTQALDLNMCFFFYKLCFKLRITIRFGQSSCQAVFLNFNKSEKSVADTGTRWGEGERGQETWILYDCH